MAKELPYFQFEPAEYLTKDISFCSLEAQGLFINLCSYYWQRECKLTRGQFLRRLNHPGKLLELIDENVIKLEGEDIIIDFLDNQYDKATSKSKTNSVNGLKGGRPRKQKPIKTEPKAKGNPNKSESKGIREDKMILDNKIEDDIYKSIDTLAEIYLNNEDIVKAVLSNDNFPINSENHLKEKMNEFLIQLKSTGETTKQRKDFNKHFMNWAKVVRKSEEKPERFRLQMSDLEITEADRSKTIDIKEHLKLGT